MSQLYLGHEDDPDGVDGHWQDVHKLSTPAAREIADLIGVQADFRFVVDVCQRLLDAIPSEPGEEPDQTLIRALWTSGLVAYARCFTSGRRGGLAHSDVDDVPGEGAADFHQWASTFAASTLRIP